MALSVNGGTHLIPAYYSFYRPRKDERLSWPSWLTYSGWLTHISGHPSAEGRVQDSESSPARDRRSTTVPCHQPESSGGSVMDDIATGAVVVQSVLHGISMWPSDRQTDIQTTEHVTSVAESCIYATHAMQHRRWYTSPTDDLQQCVYIGVAGSNRTHWSFPPVQNCVMWRTNLQYDVAVILSLMRVSISPFSSSTFRLQCFDAVGWVEGRASGL